MMRDGLTRSPQRKPFSTILLPSIGDMVFVSLLFVLAFNSGQGLLADGDTGYHIRTGEVILRTWQVPTQDPYSFHDPPLKWTAHEWLSDIIMAVVFSMLGLTGVVLFFAFLLALTHWLLYRWLRSRSNDILLCATVTLLATAASSTHWLARPHVFSLLFTVVWCHCLDRFQNRNANSLTYLPLLMLLWVNLHGGFMIGLIFLTTYLGGNVFDALTSRREQSEAHARKAKKLFVTLIVSMGVCLLNPYGLEILWFPIRLTSDRFIMDRVIEFLSPNFHEVLPFKYMLLATIGALALSRRALSVIELTLVLLLSYMALYSARHVSLFALVVAPILLCSSESILNRLPDWILQSYKMRIRNLAAIDAGLKGYLWPIFSVLLILGLAAAGTLQYRFSEKTFPVAAVEFLKNQPIAGNMFNNDEFGDYLIFAAWPAYRVFMDGRSDMYGEKYGSAYLRVAQAQRGWKEVFEKYDITWVLFVTESPLTAALQEQRDWQVIYSDHVATIFVKKVPAHRSLLTKYASVTMPK
ncbi:MAG: hypothetical protein ACREQ2_06900 [Candidatus Binatia bacterium]